MSIQTTNPILLPPVSTQNTTTYTFPSHCLKSTQTDAARKPLVLVLCGCLSPITIEHTKMFEIAADYTRINDEFEIMGGYISPVSDAYGKLNLVSARHRIRMCKVAIDYPTPSAWLMVDPWEAEQQNYTPTAQILNHFDHEINEMLGGAKKPDGSRVPYQIVFLAGADIALTMSRPVWSEEDIRHIMHHFGVFIVNRKGTDMGEVLLGSMKRYKDDIRVMHKMVEDNISSTKFRNFLSRGILAANLIVLPVREYIKQHGLFMPDPRKQES